MISYEPRAPRSPKEPSKNTCCPTAYLCVIGLARWHHPATLFQAAGVRFRLIARPAKRQSLLTESVQAVFPQKNPAPWILPPRAKPSNVQCKLQTRTRLSDCRLNRQRSPAGKKTLELATD